MIRHEAGQKVRHPMIGKGRDTGKSGHNSTVSMLVGECWAENSVVLSPAPVTQSGMVVSRRTKSLEFARESGRRTLCRHFSSPRTSLLLSCGRFCLYLGLYRCGVENHVMRRVIHTSGCEQKKEPCLTKRSVCPQIGMASFWAAQSLSLCFILSLSDISGSSALSVVLQPGDPFLWQTMRLSHAWSMLTSA